MKVGAEGSVGTIMRSGVPLDLTNYKQIVRLQDYPGDSYKISKAPIVTEIEIAHDQAYLNDVEIWGYVIPKVAADTVYTGNTILSEACQLIDSIEIYSDNDKLAYIADAGFLLSIINQRK